MPPCPTMIRPQVDRRGRSLNLTMKWVRAICRRGHFRHEYYGCYRAFSRYRGYLFVVAAGCSSHQSETAPQKGHCADSSEENVRKAD